MKIRIAGLILLAFLMFTGASPWEGAATTAPEGELPASGRYVATNAFPRNTVIDIFNIETNRSTRAIVANGLESPGLLAIVSKEAAELIGMRAGSVSRLRITQPSDPVAYLRFKNGVATGIPDYNSGNVITEENYREVEWDREEAEAQALPSSEKTIPTVVQGAPPYFLEPEWSGDGRRSIVDLPDPAEKVAWEAVEEEETELFEEESEIVELPEAEQPEEIEEELAEAVFEEEIEEELTEAVEEEIEEEKAEEIADLPEEENEIADITEYNLVEAEDRPPNDIYGIDPDSIIPGVSLPEYEPENELAYEPIPDYTPESSYIAPDYTPELNFSVQRIYDLERGRYYVQIAAYDAPELVESVIDEIDKNFKPVVYKDGDSWYRVLLGGPQGLNQGESAAVLQRFKSIGYKDAFVRYAR